MSAAILLLFRLYLIEILHQTTTVSAISAFLFGCILLKFYIKPQQSSYCLVSFEVVSYWNSTSNHNCTGCHSTPEALYLIEILHQTTTREYGNHIEDKLYLIEILHQTTTPVVAPFEHFRVVSYWNSTSNHNLLRESVNCWRVVSYWNSTSNHNPVSSNVFTPGLYLIEILHQTTTLWLREAYQLRCILLKFYIKPQHKPLTRDIPGVVSYWNSTSNHNDSSVSRRET